MWCSDIDVSVAAGYQMVVIGAGVTAPRQLRPAGDISRLPSAAPVFDPKPGNASHVIEVGRNECGIERERMRRDRGIEIPDSRSAALQRCLDATVRVTDGIGPFGSWKFRANEIEPCLQRAPALRTWQSPDPKRDLREYRLGNRDVSRFGCGQPFNDRRPAFHERRNGVSVRDVDHRCCGCFERRACFTAASSSSTAAAVSRSTLRSCSRSSGAQSERSVTARSSARTIGRFRLRPSAFAPRSTDFQQGCGDAYGRRHEYIDEYSMPRCTLELSIGCKSLNIRRLMWRREWESFRTSAYDAASSGSMIPLFVAGMPRSAATAVPRAG